MVFGRLKFKVRSEGYYCTSNESGRTLLNQGAPKAWEAEQANCPYFDAE